MQRGLEAWLGIVEISYLEKTTKLFKKWFGTCQPENIPDYSEKLSGSTEASGKFYSTVAQYQYPA
jgi:hypothetical protein